MPLAGQPGAGGGSARSKPLQLGCVKLQVADEQLLDELMDGDHAPGGVDTLRLPGAVGDVTQKGSEVAQVLLGVMPQRAGPLVPVVLDCGGVVGVCPGAAKGDRVGRVRGQHPLHLRDPVGDEVGQVGPDLAGVPALPAGRVGVGATLQPFPGEVAQPDLDCGQAPQEVGRGVGGEGVHRWGLRWREGVPGG